MRWYRKLYTGKKAKDCRFEILQGIRSGKAAPNSYAILPAENPRNLLDIVPCRELNLDHYKKRNPLILGIASGEDDAAELAARILLDFGTDEHGFSPDNLSTWREKIKE